MNEQQEVSAAGHRTFTYGQSSADGDACRDCSWEGPVGSGGRHTAETRPDSMTAEQQGSDESGEGLATCPGHIPVEHTIGTLPDDCDVCAPANAHLQAVLADRLAAVQADRDKWGRIAEQRLQSEVAAKAALATARRDADELRDRLAAVEAVRLDVEHSRTARGEDPVITMRDGTPADVGAMLRIALANPSAAQGEGEGK